MKPCDLVIFDLDGTLVDSAPDIAWALNATLQEEGIAPLPLDVVTGLVGDGAAKLIQRATAGTTPGRDPAALLARFLDHYARHLSVETRLYPGVADLLQSLSRARVAVALLTNKPRGLAQALLDALSIAHHFAAVVGDGDEFPRKPDPAGARAIIARVGVTAARTVMVGDGLPDVRLSHAVPCAGVAALWGYVSAARLRAENPTYLARSAHEAER
ncbi:MAG: HAD-IA family hydrolase, partial [Verrucomicrobiota bacterium]